VRGSPSLGQRWRDVTHCLLPVSAVQGTAPPTRTEPATFTSLSQLESLDNRGGFVMPFTLELVHLHAFGTVVIGEKHILLALTNESRRLGAFFHVIPLIFAADIELEYA